MKKHHGAYSSTRQITAREADVRPPTDLEILPDVGSPSRVKVALEPEVPTSRGRTVEFDEWVRVFPRLLFRREPAAGYCTPCQTP